MEHPSLIEGHSYALRVRAYRDYDQPLNVNNSGYSSIVRFTYGVTPEDATDDDIIIDSTVQEPPVELDGDVEDQDMACGDQCNFALAGNQTSNPTAPKSGDILDIGNYKLRISNISGTETYSGAGIIQATTYMPLPIKVTFTGLKVNKSNRVYAGTATAEIRNESWINQTWGDINTEVKSIGRTINRTNYTSISAFAKDMDNHIDNLESAYQNIGTTLPFSIGISNQTLQVVGMNFSPTKASYNLSYIMELADDPNGKRYLHFMAKDLCISPGGPSLSAEEAKMELMQPLNYTFDSSTKLEFEIANAKSQGTYMTFDCAGFNGVHATGSVIFDNKKFKPVTEDGKVIVGDSVRANFVTSFTSWSDWIAYVNFDANKSNNKTSTGLFTYSELDDYLIKIEHAYIDHSVNRNFDGMAFPENYSKELGNDWQGVYIQTLRVDLPAWVKSHENKDNRVRLLANDMIIDSDGVTGIIHGKNILSANNGAMGKWPLSIDSVMIRLTDSNLDQAFILGDLKIPLIDEGFAYTADIQYYNSQTRHNFTFQPLESYSFSPWFAEATLEENSSLAVEILNGSPYIEANLNGKISFASVIGDIDKMNLTDITFQGMKIRSEKRGVDGKPASYVDFGTIGTGISAQSLAVAGFGIALNKIDWMEDAVNNAGLAIGVTLDLAGGFASISGKTELFIKNKIEQYADSISFNRDGTEVKDIYVEASTSGVKMAGGISFFKNDPKFGEGFEGSLNLAFLESITLKGNVLFGNVEDAGTEVNTTYWYAHAMGYMPSAPVPLATPLDVYGFGGGVYYNMSLNKSFPKPSADGGGTFKVREAFDVEKGILGLQASVILGLTPSSQTFNAEATLSVEIDRNTGGLNRIAFRGKGYLMQDIEEADSTQAMITANVNVDYDLTEKIIKANFGVLGAVPKKNPLLTVTGDINFYRSPDLWYLKAGVPATPMNASVNVGLSGITANAYFMTGENLESPVLPAEIDRFFKFNSNLVNSTQNGLGIGFMAGMHLGINTELTLWGSGITVVGRAGADLAVLNYFAATCNGREDFGINKWYAQGRGYVYGKMALEVLTFEVTSVELGIMVEGAFPNPIGIKGKVVAKAKLFGIIDANTETTLTIGSFCDMQPLADASAKIDRKEKELDNLKFIGLIEPAKGEFGVSTNARPTIQWHYKDTEPKRFIYGNGLGGIIDLQYRIRNEVEWEIKSGNNTWNKVNYRKSFDETNKFATLIATSANGDLTLLNGLKDYRIRANSYIEKFNESATGASNRWVAATYSEGKDKGKPITEKVVHEFKTQTNLTEIDQFYVDYTLPYPRQRYYPYGYLNVGKIKFNVDHEAKFQDFEDCGFTLYAEFDPLDGTGSLQRELVTREGLLEVKYKMSDLNPETTYKLQIVAERNTTQSEINSNKKCQLNEPEAASSWLESYGITRPNVTAIAGGSNLPVFVDVWKYGNLFNPSGNTGNTGGIPSGIPPTIPGVNSGGGSSSAPQSNPNEATVTQRFILYTIHFRTSKYATPQEKLNTITATGVSVTSERAGYGQNTTFIKDAVIHLDAGEGFDKYDLVGHDYRTSETMEYFRAYGPSCHYTSGLNNPVKQWFETAASELYRFGSYGTKGGGGFEGGGSSNNSFVQQGRVAQQIADGQKQLWQVDFKTDASNYTGFKGIDPLLSDAEVGISSPPTQGIFVAEVMPLYVTAVFVATGSSGSSGSGGNYMGGLSGGGYNPGAGFGIGGGNTFGSGGFDYNSYLGNSGGLTSGNGPIGGGGTVMEGTEGILELEYPVARTAYDMGQFLMNNSYPIGENYKYTTPPTGIYPIRIDLSNTTYDANSGDSNDQSKTMNVNIPF